MNRTIKVLIIREGHKNLKRKNHNSLPILSMYCQANKIRLFFIRSGLLIINELYKITQGAAQHRGKQIGITAAPWLFA